MQKISKILFNKRTELNLNQDEMAVALGMKARMYAYYEKGTFDNTYSIRRDRLLKKLKHLKPQKEKLFISGQLIKEIGELKSRVKLLEDALKKNGTNPGTKKKKASLKMK